MQYVIFLCNHIRELLKVLQVLIMTKIISQTRLCVFVPLYSADVPSWIAHKETSQCGTAESGIRGKVD